MSEASEEKSFSDRLRSFYENHLRALEFGNAVADVILVPVLALNLVGAITIKTPYVANLIAVFAFIDVSSTAILLIGGFLGHRTPKIACANCGGVMAPVVSRWTCESCGATLKPPKKGGQ